MRPRLFLVFLPTLYSTVGLADEAAWNCQQSDDGKEWVCVGDSKAEAKAKADQPQEAAQSEPVKTAEPVVTEAKPVTEPAPAKAEAKADQPPASAQPEPVITEAAPVTESAAAEPVQVEEPITPAAEESTQEVQPKPAQAAKPDKERPIYVTQPVIHEAGEPAPVELAPSKSETVADKQQPPGWQCDASSEDQSWDCNLKGADPKGQARIVASDELKSGLLEPAFDLEQERTFENLHSLLPYDPWQNCTIHMGAPEGFVSKKDLRETSPLDIHSDYSELYDAEISSYFGNVEMRRADQHVQSDKASYDTVSETLDLQGNVHYSDDSLALYSNTAALRLQSDQARIRDALFITPSTPLRGRAQVVYRDSKDLSRYKDVAYTSCRPGNQDWVIHASELKLNNITGQGAAKNTWLEFKGVPVFYSPYLSFPMDSRRLSGFLAPSWGNTQRSGFDFSVPYYWNIAPNYDATFKPRYLTKRGILLGGNFRYLTEQNTGTLAAEVLPNDDVLDEPRYQGSLKHSTAFTPNLNSNLDLNYVSDKEYFNDLGNALNLNRYSFLRSTADVNYRTEGVSFVTRAENYQSIDRAIQAQDEPYRRLPQANLNLNHTFDVIDRMPLLTAMENEYVYFQHDDFDFQGQSGVNLINAQRLNIKPYVSAPLETAGAYVKPKISLQHTQYFFNDQDAVLLNSRATRPGGSDSISRTLPIASVDTGLFFEKDLDLAGSAFTHTIEPRLFYLYIPKTGQNDIPLYDTSLYDFNYSSLFRENRFSGVDRVQDANQITTAVTSRLIDPKTGRDRLKLDIGEIFYFADREVTLCGDYYSTLCNETAFIEGKQVGRHNMSNLVTELSAALTDHISLQTGVQWDPIENDVVRYEGALHFVNQPDQIFNIGYRYRKNTFYDDAARSRDIIQTDVSARWPVYDNWYAVGRWQYSLLLNSTQESFFGLEKESCCWRFRIIGRRWVNRVNTNTIDPFTTEVQGDSQTGVFFQVELKGLTGIGEKLDEFFEQNIYGYRKPQD